MKNALEQSRLPSLFQQLYSDSYTGLATPVHIVTDYEYFVTGYCMRKIFGNVLDEARPSEICLPDLIGKISWYMCWASSKGITPLIEHAGNILLGDEVVIIDIDAWIPYARGVSERPRDSDILRQLEIIFMNFPSAKHFNIFST